MARKSMKDAATAGTSVFEQIANGNAIDAKDVQNVKNAKGAKGAKNAKRAQGVKGVPKADQCAPEKVELERLNLKIPADIKAYLQAAAYRESSPTKTVSLTEYLCQLVRADMKKHKDK